MSQGLHVKSQQQQQQQEEEEDNEEDGMGADSYYGDGDSFMEGELDSEEEEVLDFTDPFSTEVKPRILLMGLRRSGKSSIQKVVFHKMSPNETLFFREHKQDLQGGCLE